MMMSSDVGQRNARPRFFWAVLISALINSLLCLSYRSLSLDRTVPSQKIAVSTIHVVHRKISHHHARRRIVTHPRIASRPIPIVRAVVPQRPIVRKRVVPIAKIAAVPKVGSHHRFHRHHHVARPRPSTESASSLLDDEIYATKTFETHQAARLDLPTNWGTQDMANGAAAQTTIWLDFKKARGASVPRVFLLHLKTEFMSGPTLADAVKDIVGNLRSDGAKVFVSKAQRVCGGRRMGWFLSYEKPYEDPPWQFEDTMFVDGDTIYRAVYSRPDHQPEDARTRRALNTLCPLP